MDVQSTKQKLKRILVAREQPVSSASPYLKLEERYNVKLDFRSFISTSGISLPEFRKLKPKILSHTAIIFTNKVAIDHFFQSIKPANIQLSEDVKYFCATAGLAHYLQKYTILKKRKVFKAGSDIASFFSVLKKHKKEKFLVPSSEMSRKDVIEFLKEYGYSYTKIIIYKVLKNDFKDVRVEDYDVIVLFSLLDVRAFVKNFPNPNLKNTKMAVFGSATARAVKEAGLSFHIYAPTEKVASMVEALDLYLKDT